MAKNPGYKTAFTWDAAKKEAAKMRKNGMVVKIEKHTIKTRQGTENKHYSIMGGRPDTKASRERMKKQGFL